MNKEEFMWILQSALLNWDGTTEKELIELGATPKQAQIGIKLCKYIKDKN